MPLVAAVFAASLVTGPLAPVATDRLVPAADESSSAFTAGTFRFAGGQKQRDRVHDAVERAVQALLPVFHDAARKRLSAANAVPEQVSISMEGEDLVVKYGDLQPQRAPLDGSIRRWTNREGTRVKITHRMRGERLVQKSWSPGGQRVAVWSISEDGRTLRLHAVMSSKLLPVAIEYRLTFKRQ